MRRAGCKLDRLATAGYAPHDLLAANFTLSEIVELGGAEASGATFSPDQWQRAGFSCRALKEANCSLTYLQVKTADCLRPTPIAL